MNADRKSTARERIKHKNLVSDRVVLCICLAFTCALVLTFLYRIGLNLSRLQTFNTAVNLLIGLSLVLTGLSFYRMHSAKGGDPSAMILPPAVQLFLSLLGVGCCVFLRFYYLDAIRLLYVLIPALCLVYLIKVVFGNAFFLVSAFLLLSGCCLYVFDRLLLWAPLHNAKIVFGVLLLALGVAQLVLAARVSAAKGTVKYRGKAVVLLKKDASYLPFYLAALVVAGIGACFILSPSMAAFYGLIALGAALVLSGLYYTFALMYH